MSAAAVSSSLDLVLNLESVTIRLIVVGSSSLGKQAFPSRLRWFPPCSFAFSLAPKEHLGNDWLLSIMSLSLSGNPWRSVEHEYNKQLIKSELWMLKSSLNSSSWAQARFVPLLVAVLPASSGLSRAHAHQGFCYIRKKKPADVKELESSFEGARQHVVKVHCATASFTTRLSA